MTTFERTKRFDAFSISGVTNDGFTLGAGASKVLAVQTADGNTSYIHDNTGAAATQGYKIDGSFTERMAKINSVDIYMRADTVSGNALSNRVQLRLGGNLWQSSPFTVSNASDAYPLYGPFTASRPGGGLFTEADFRDSSFEFEIFTPSQATDLKVTELYFIVSYEPGIPIEQNQAVNRGSRVLRMFKDGLPIIVAELDLRHLDREVMGECLLYDSDLPQAATERAVLAAGIRSLTAGRYVRLLTSDFDMDELKLIATFADLTRYRALMASTARSDKVNNLNRGHVELLNGAERLYASVSNLLLVDSAAEDLGAAKLVEIYTGVEPRNDRGTILEIAGLNLIPNNAFIDGLTGWSTVDNSVGTITAVAGNTLMSDQAFGDNNIVFEKTSASATEMYLHRGSMSPFDGGVNTISVWHREEFASSPSDILRIALQEDGGNWYDWSADTFSDGSPNYLSVPASTVRARFARPVQGISLAETYTVRFQMLPTAANGDKIFLSQVQMNGPGFLTREQSVDNSIAQIAGYLGSGATLDDQLRYRQDFSESGRYCFGPKRGTFRFRLSAELDEAWPTWGNKRIGADDGPTLFAWREGWTGSAFANGDAVWLYHDEGNSLVYLRFGRWRSDAASGDVAEALLPNFVPGAVFECAVRWTSSDGELLLPALTASVFVDGVKGTDAVFGAEHSLSVDQELRVGSCWSDEPASFLGDYTAYNYLSDWESLPRPLPDEAILAGR